MSTIDRLTNLIASVTADPLIAMIASAVVLTVFSAWWIAFRRLTGMQMQIDELRRDIRGLEAEYSGWIVRQSNLPKPRSRKARKLSSPSSDVVRPVFGRTWGEEKRTLGEGKMTAAALPNEKHSEEYLVAPQTASELNFQLIDPRTAGWRRVIAATRDFVNQQKMD
jgi:hypothetical protein